MSDPDRIARHGRRARALGVAAWLALPAVLATGALVLTMAMR